MTEENPNLVINQHSNINIEINKGEEENSSIKLKKEVLNKDFYLKNKREYGIDLLRILAMFMVINTHLGNGSNFNKQQPILSFKRYFFYFIYYWGRKCNIVFGMISWYVGLNSRNKLNSIISLIITSTIYSIILEIIYIKKNNKKYTILQYINILFPFSRNVFWYYTSYIGLFFFKPYINLIIKTISKKDSKKILIFIFIFFSLITSIFNSDAFGIQRYHSLFWLSIYYYYGAYIKMHGIFLEKYSKFIILLINLFALLLNVLLIFLSELNIVKWNNNYYNFEGFKLHVNPLLIICSICELIFFKDLNVYVFIKKIISIISPSVFFVYILGFNFNTIEYYKIIIINQYNLLGIIMFFFYKNIYIASICIFIDYIRRLIFNFLNMNILFEKLSFRIEDLIAKFLQDN